MRVLGQEVEQKLGLNFGQPPAPVGGDTLFELGPREDTRSLRVLALAESLELSHQAVKLGVVQRVYCLWGEEEELEEEGGAARRGQAAVSYFSVYRQPSGGRSGLGGFGLSLMMFPQQ